MVATTVGPCVCYIQLAARTDTHPFLQTSHVSRAALHLLATIYEATVSVAVLRMVVLMRGMR